MHQSCTTATDTAGATGGKAREGVTQTEPHQVTTFMTCTLGQRMRKDKGFEGH